MKVLLIGGTGIIGTHLSYILAEKEVETFVTSRIKREDTNHIHYIQGNALNDTFFDKIIKQEKWDAIVDFMVYGTNVLRMRLPKLLSSTLQYVFISSARVYAESLTPIKETSNRLIDVCSDREYLLTDEYALSKGREEDLLSNNSKKNWTIIRPYITFGKNRLQLGDVEKENWLYRALHGRTIVFSEDIANTITTMTYGLDVANGISAIIGKKEAFGETFHITTQESHKWIDIVGAYQKVFTKKNGCPMKIQIQKKAPFYEKYQVKYDRLYNREFDNSKIGNFVNISTFSPTLETLELCLEQFMDCPKFLKIDWKKEGYLDRLTKEYTSLREIPSFKNKLWYILYRFFICYRRVYRIKQKLVYYGNRLHK